MQIAPERPGASGTAFLDHGAYAQPRAVSIKFESVTKRFGSKVALDDVTCDVAGGSLHVFLGENGAGKSTLMKLLAGGYAPDSGTIRLDGNALRLRSPADARAAGVGMVYQHLTLIPSMTVLENVVLGDPRAPFLLRSRTLTARVQRAAQEHGFSFDLRAPARTLSMSARQQVEVFKLLWRDARVLVLDEPTSQLAPFEAGEVLSTLQRLARAGRTVLLVTHDIENARRFGTRITVMRRGKVSATVEPHLVPSENLARLMMGDVGPPPRRPSVRAGMREPFLTLRDVAVEARPGQRSLHAGQLDIRPGEVLGIAGIAGSGQAELVGLLTGHLRPDQGTLIIRGMRQPWRALALQHQRAAHVPADPGRSACALGLPVRDNALLGDLRQARFRRGPFLRRQAMTAEVQRRLARFDVQPANARLPCGALSGGNLQRLVLARELALGSALVVAVNPTAGLDLAGSRLALQALREHADGGQAIVLVSHDLGELLAVCDRIGVLFAGELVAVEPADQWDSESVGLLMGGVPAEVVKILSGDGEEARLALRERWSGFDRYQRRHAARHALRVLQPQDAAWVQACLRPEPDDEARVWLLLTLARIQGEPELGQLVSAFAQEPRGFVAAQAEMLLAPDLPGAIRDRLREGTSEAWETTLGVLTLKHLNTRLDEALVAVLRVSSSPTVRALLRQCPRIAL